MSLIVITGKRNFFVVSNLNHFCHATMKEVFIRLENPCHAEDARSCLVLQNQIKKPREKLLPDTMQLHHTRKIRTPLSVGLGDTLQLVLLLDCVRVAASLGSVDQLLSKALGNALDVAERGFAGTDGKESDGLVDTAEG